MRSSGRINSLDDFVDLSAVLTGFDNVELQGTGLVDSHFDTITDLVGERIFGRLLLTWREIRSDENVDNSAEIRSRILDNPLIGPVARNLMVLWYTGNWNQMPGKWRDQYGAAAGDRTHVVSSESYKQGLMWRAVLAHPPAARQPGFGSWTPPPEGGEDIEDEWQQR